MQITTRQAAEILTISEASTGDFVAEGKLELTLEGVLSFKATMCDEALGAGSWEGLLSADLDARQLATDALTKGLALTEGEEVTEYWDGIPVEEWDAMTAEQQQEIQDREAKLGRMPLIDMPAGSEIIRMPEGLDGAEVEMVGDPPMACVYPKGMTAEEWDGLSLDEQRKAWELSFSGTVAGVPRKQPLYYQRVIQPGESAEFFVHNDHLDAIGYATNLPDRRNPDGSGPTEGLGMREHFFAYGFSLIPDMESPQAPRYAVRALRDRGRVTFSFGFSELTTVPARLCMRNPDDLESFDAKHVEPEPYDPRDPLDRQKGLDFGQHDITLDGKPMSINAAQDWRMTVHAPEDMRAPVHVMLVLHGVWLKGLAACEA